MILPITLTMAAAAALLNVWLAMRIGRLRMAKDPTGGTAHSIYNERGWLVGTVSPEGSLTEFVAQRYAGSDLETWSVPITAYGEFEGLKLPVRCKAVWKLADGDQEYIDVNIVELRYED